MDTKKLLEEICDSGMTQVEIGLEVGLAQPSISDLMRGRTKSPSLESGLKILELHKKIFRSRDIHVS